MAYYHIELTRYMTVSATSRNRFDQTVNVYLYRGWELTGSLCVTKNWRGKVMYTQALKIHGEEDPSGERFKKDMKSAVTERTMNFSKPGLSKY